MVQYCIVYGCKSSAKTLNVSFHCFPACPKLKKEWVRRIRRDKSNKPVSEYMRVCSVHFVPEDYRESSESGVTYRQRRLKEGAVPSVFTFTSPRKLKGPRRRLERKTDDNLTFIQGLPEPELIEQPTDIRAERLLPNSENADEEAFLAPGVTIETNIEQTEPLRDITNDQLPATHKPKEDIHRRHIVLQATIDSLERDVTEQKKLLEEKTNQLTDKIDSVTARPPFNMDVVKSDPAFVTYYTGFDSALVLDIFHDFIDPQRVITFSTKLSGDDQLLLVLCKLRQGFENFDLGVRFNISQKSVSKIFVSWINYLYHRLGCLSIWPHRDVILANAPKEFLAKHPKTIVILDGTELKIQTPTSLVVQSQSYSTYKSHNTVKALVGCDPKGGITFISQLYTGSISDKQITQASGLYDVLKRKLNANEILPGDVVMVDKGFNISKEIEALGLVLNVPPMACTEQFSEEQVQATRKIASCRINVERVIRRIKTFKILTGVIPVTMLPNLNQVWTVCCILTGFRCVTKSKTETV